MGFGREIAHRSFNRYYTYFIYGNTVIKSEFLRPLFHTAPLDAEGAIWIASMSLVPFVLGEVVKLTGAMPSTMEKKV